MCQLDRRLGIERLESRDFQIYVHLGWAEEETLERDWRGGGGLLFGGALHYYHCTRPITRPRRLIPTDQRMEFYVKFIRPCLAIRASLQLCDDDDG